VQGRFVRSMLLLGLSLAPAALAKPSPMASQCLNAYEAGQRLQKAGELTRARASFEFCASDACPSALHADCTHWLEELVVVMPSVSLRVTDASGQDLPEVTVTIDDGEASALTDRALALEPGEHTLAFEHPRFRPLRRKLTLALAERASVVVELERIAPTPATPSPARESASKELSPTRAQLWPIWVGLGVGAVGAAGLSYFGLSARSSEQDLSRCSPNCSRQAVSEVRQDYALANISLVVGGAGLLGAGVWALFGTRTSAPAAALSPRVQLAIGPVSSLSGTF